jgi:hypothetical protein
MARRSEVLAPLQFLVLVLAGWIQREQAHRLDFLLAQNRVLRARLGARRLRLTDPERRLLAEKGRAVGRRLLEGLSSLATPETILRWYRDLAAAKYDGSRRRGGGDAVTAGDCRRRRSAPRARRRRGVRAGGRLETCENSQWANSGTLRGGPQIALAVATRAAARERDPRQRGAGGRRGEPSPAHRRIGRDPPSASLAWVLRPPTPPQPRSSPSWLVGSLPVLAPAACAARAPKSAAVAAKSLACGATRVPGRVSQPNGGPVLGRAHAGDTTGGRGTLPSRARRSHARCA